MSFIDFLNETEETVTESVVKFAALEEMKEIQATLGSISFISVVGVMREDNPLKKNIHEFEQKLHELTVAVSTFINDNLADAVEDTEDTEDAEDAEDTEDESQDRVDKAVKTAEEEEIEKKSPKPKED